MRYRLYRYSNMAVDDKLYVSREGVSTGLTRLVTEAKVFPDYQSARLERDGREHLSGKFFHLEEVSDV